MPTRQNVKEVPSDVVQGEGSWVKVRRPTVKEVKEGQAKYDVARNAKADKESNMEGAYDEACVKALKFCLGWNWVDDEGKPLPQPTEPGVRDTLTDDEVTFILDELFGSKENRKN